MKTPTDPAASSRLCIVRHAAAGSRQRWQAADDLRPLTPKGMRQAAVIAQRYVGQCRRIVTSPYLRCLETIAPLSTTSGIDVEETELLAEGADPQEAFEWLVEITHFGEIQGIVVACTHGDVIEAIVGIVGFSGVKVVPEPIGVEKAATIEIDFSEGTITSARYLKAPKTEALNKSSR